MRSLRVTFSAYFLVAVIIAKQCVKKIKIEKNKIKLASFSVVQNLVKWSIKVSQ